MFCKNCGTEINGDDKFCNNCGAPVEEAQPVTQAAASSQYQQAQYGQPTYVQPTYVAAPVAPVVPVVYLSKKEWFANHRTPTANGMYIASMITTLITTILFIIFMLATIGEASDYYGSAGDGFVGFAVISLGLLTPFMFCGCFGKVIGLSIASIPISFFFLIIGAVLDTGMRYLSSDLYYSPALSLILIGSIAQTVFNGVINSEYNKAKMMLH